MNSSQKQQTKPIKVLIMSVGPFEKNWTVRYLSRIGRKDNFVVCLPMQFADNAESYRSNGIEVYLYDEKKYINGSFEFFGFKPRNCGGVGRQGIAEATEKYGKDFLVFQMDDDYTSFDTYCFGRKRYKAIRKWDNFVLMVRAFAEFDKMGIDMAARTGATKPDKDDIANRQIFNNFIMRPGNDLNFEGFAALCSDDQRFNMYTNLLQCRPTLSTRQFSVLFHQNQGDRNDGNAPMYNGDCSWKKSFALKMMMPWAIAQYVRKESNRALFREHIECSKLYPPIMLQDKSGKITSYV